MADVLQTLLEKKIIAIVRGVSSEPMVPLIESLLAGGISCVEITFSHDSGSSPEDIGRQIHVVKERFGEDITVGAGTVLTVEEVKLASARGAQFILSPNVDPAIIETSKALGLVTMPGAFTPTEIQWARSCGADIVKLFPAGFAGPGYIKDIHGPLPDIRLSAVGGISPDNVADFLEAGACCVGVGGNLVSIPFINGGRFDKITETAELYVSKVFRESA